MEQEQFSAILQFGLQGVLLPFATSALLMWASARFLRKFNPVFSALAIGGAFLAAYFLAYRPAFPPREIQDQLYLYALVAIAVFAVADLRQIPSFAVTMAKTLFALTVAYLVVKPLIPDWGSEKTVQTLVGVVLVWMTIWQNFAKSAREPGTTPLVLAIAATGGGISIMLANSALLGQFSIAIGASVAGWQLLHLFYPETRFGYSGFAVAIAVLNGLLLACYFYAGLTPLELLLIVVSLFSIPITATISYFFPDMHPRWKTRLTLIIAILPVAVLLGLAYYSYQSAEGY